MTTYVSEISFDCPECDARNGYRLTIPETNWNGETADERFACEVDAIPCGGCGRYFDVEVGNQDGAIRVLAIDRSDFHINAGQAKEVVDDLYDDDDLAYDIPEQPRQNLWNTLLEVRELLDRLGDEHRSSVLNRMVFTQQIAALEAYLSDTLLREVAADRSALRKIVTGDNELKLLKLSLLAALDSPDAVKTTVLEHLRKQSFHNLGKVQVLYRIAFSFDILPNREQRDRLQAAIHARHDCVHRNGFDKHGEPLNYITANYVRQMERDIRSLVENIEIWLEPPI